MDKFFVSFYPKTRDSQMRQEMSVPRSHQYLLNQFQKQSSKQKTYMNKTFHSIYRQEFSPRLSLSGMKSTSEEESVSSFQHYILNKYEQSEDLDSRLAILQHKSISFNQVKQKNQENILQTRDLNPYAYKRLIDRQMQQTGSFITENMVRLQSEQRLNQQSLEIHDFDDFIDQNYNENELKQLSLLNNKSNLSKQQNTTLENKIQEPDFKKPKDFWKYSDKFRQLCQQYGDNFKNIKPHLSDVEKINFMDSIQHAINDTQQHHDPIPDQTDIPIFIGQIDIPQTNFSHLGFLQSRLDESLKFQGFQHRSLIQQNKTALQIKNDTEMEGENEERLNERENIGKLKQFTSSSKGQIINNPYRDDPNKGNIFYYTQRENSSNFKDMNQLSQENVKFQEIQGFNNYQDAKLGPQLISESYMNRDFYNQSRVSRCFGENKSLDLSNFNRLNRQFDRRNIQREGDMIDIDKSLCSDNSNFNQARSSFCDHSMKQIFQNISIQNNSRDQFNFEDSKQFFIEKLSYQQIDKQTN